MSTHPRVTEDVDLARLQAIYERLVLQNVPAVEFAQAVEAIDWDSKSADAFDDAIHMALGVDATSLAYRLAQRGPELYPENDALRRAAIVLGPPKVLASRLPPVPGLRDSMIWLREHRAEYANQWVALKDGELLASAQTREQLMSLIGPVSKQDNVLLTKIDWWQSST